VVDPVRNLISKTVAKTSVLLRDGEQTAIGGLYGEVVSVSRNGVPFLKDLPAWMFGLRYLFGHESTQYSKTELVVMLKVDLVPSVRERVERLSRETGKAK
jgi:type IV pilus assembly protein PilQ